MAQHTPHTYSTGDTITAALLNQAEADLAAAIPKADADAAYDAKGAATAAQAAAVQRANHTGTQSADTLTDGTTNKAYTAAEKTKLAGVATGATANSTDAQLRDRSTHTGTQAASTVTGLSAVATSGAYTDLSGKPTAYSLSVLDYGAKCDGQVGYTGQATAGSATFTDPGAAFTSALVGRVFTMPYAGATLGVWTGTVTAVPSATTLTISTTAGTNSQITGTAGAMTSGTQVLTDSTATFTQDLMGATITVNGAGTAGAALSGQVLSPTADGHGLYLIGPMIGNQNQALNAVTTVSGASYTINRGMYTIGSDDATAWASAVTAAQAKLATSGQAIIRWAGTSMVSSMPIIPGGIVLEGVGTDPVQTGTAYPTQGSILRAHGTFSGTQVLRMGTFSQYREDSLAGALRSCTIDAARVVAWAIKTTGNWSSMDRAHARNGTSGAVWLAGWQTMMRDCTFGQHGIGDCLFVQEADAQMIGGYLKSGANMLHLGAGWNDLMLTGVHTYNSWPAAVGGENHTVLIDQPGNRASFTACYFDNVYGPQVKVVNTSGGNISEIEFTACKFFQAGTPWYTFPDNTYPIFQLDNSAGGGAILERLLVTGCSGSAVWSGARFSAIVNYVVATGVSGITVANSSFSHCAALYTGSTPAQASFPHVKALDSAAGIWRTSPFPLGNTNPLTATGDGAKTAFSITHNMHGVPKRTSVIPQTSAAAAPFYVTVQTDTLTINYLTAPANAAALAWFVTVEL